MRDRAMANIMHPFQVPHPLMCLGQFAGYDCELWTGDPMQRLVASDKREHK
jgi:hypothetical protein